MLEWQALRREGGSSKSSGPASGTMTGCGCRMPLPSTPLPRCSSLPECGAADGASSGKVLSFIPGVGAGIRLMLACRTIGPVRVCGGAQLTDVNTTAKAKFVNSAKSVAVSGILPMTSMHVELIVERVAGDSAIGTDIMLAGHARAPWGLRVMWLSVALPNSDDE